LNNDVKFAAGKTPWFELTVYTVNMYAYKMANGITSGADSMGHGGTPPLLQMAGQQYSVNKKLTKLY